MKKLQLGKGTTSWLKVSTVKTPLATDTFTPVRHCGLARLVENGLIQSGYTIEDSDYVLGRDGQRFFGAIAASKNESEVFSPVVGFRNSHDKSYKTGMFIGVRDNETGYLDFLYSLDTGRRHTQDIDRDLNQVLNMVLARLERFVKESVERRLTYRAEKIDNANAALLINRLAEVESLPKSKTYDCFDLFRKTGLNNVYAVHLAYQKIMYGSDGMKFAERSMAAIDLLDLSTVNF